MVTVDQVLRYLQLRYNGQLVLYSGQIAEVLGRSEKALANLRERGTFPFRTKVLGGRMCVDIFQIAEWVATHDEDFMSALQTADSETCSTATPIRPTNSRQSNRKGLGAKLMQMRYESARSIGRYLGAAANTLEADFLCEIAANLAIDGATQSDSLIVEAVWWNPTFASGCDYAEDSARFSMVKDVVMHLWYVQAHLVCDATISVFDEVQCIYKTQHLSGSKTWEVSLGNDPVFSEVEKLAYEMWDD